MTALQGVKVVDFTRVHAGPFASMVLADLGAAVLKIEQPAGDDTRRMTLMSYGDMSAFFVASNRNKSSLVLDLGRPDSRETLNTLIRSADVIMDNFRPATLTRLGLDYESVARLNSRIISVSVTGYGAGTPDGDQPSYDLLAQARAGVMSLNGEPGGRPLKVGVPIGDLIAGLYAATGAIAALREREVTGKGQRVEVAMLDAQIAMLHYHYSYYDASGKLLPRIGSHHQNMAPYGIFECADGYLAIAAVPEPPKFWAALCKALDREDWMEDSRFATPDLRVAHRAEMSAELEGVLRTRPRTEWFGILRDAGVPAAPVSDLSDLERDEQITAREMLVECVSSAYGRVRMPGNPIKMDGARPGSDWTAPPVLGELGDIDPEQPDWRRRSDATSTRPQTGEVFNQALIGGGPTNGGYSLRAWRCDSCERLAFGVRDCCPVCGHVGGKETRLKHAGTLETWSSVAARDNPYVIGYALVDAVDRPQSVRVFAPIDVPDEGRLVPGCIVGIAFRVASIDGEQRLHHYFTLPAADAEERLP